MQNNDTYPGKGPFKAQNPAIQFLAEAAVRALAQDGAGAVPKTHAEWVGYLCDAVLADGDVKQQVALTQMFASGTSSDTILHELVPEVARRLGEKWVADEVSFVDVTVGSAKLQAMFNSRDDAPRTPWGGKGAPQGDVALMVVPEFEQHTLGAFVAADDFRHNGVWARVGLLISAHEVCEMLQANHFSMLGLSIGSRDSVTRTAEFVKYIRKNADEVPPVVVSGNVVERLDIEWSETGADFVVSSVREAIDRCGLKPAVDQTLLEAEAL